LTPKVRSVIIEERKMLITSERNKAAWNIRKRLAKQRNCKLLDISWKECLATVERGLEKVITKVTDYKLKSLKNATFQDRLNLYKSLWAKAGEYLRCRLAGMEVVESIKRVWFGLTETVRVRY
jgi:hypothetical protein